MICTIGICTCRNPEGLKKALEALVQHETKYVFRVIIVDNDAGEAGRQVAAEFSSQLDLEYHQEPTPGIPFARNTLIAAAMKKPFDHLIMFDDDEQPLEGWLDLMVDTAIKSGADIVGGGVIPNFEVEPASPVERSDFEKSGPAIINGKVAIDSTANILLSAAFLKKWDEPLFDSRFQFSGGSDSELLRRTSARGYQHAFAKGAFVVEDIPESRCREEWLLKRNYRNGNVLGRVTIFHHGPASAIIKVLPRSIVLWWRGVLRGAIHQADARKRYLARKDRARARGMLAALRGSVMQEYADSAYRNAK